MTAAVLAAAAGGAAVLSAWELLQVAEGYAAGGGPRRLLAPWRAAGLQGLAPSAAERRRLAALGVVTLALAGGLLLGPAGAAVAALAAPAAVGRLVAWRRARWRERAAGGAAVVARALADALSGGRAVRAAIDDVARTGGAGQEADAGLRGLAAALAVGEPTPDALEAWRQRMGSAPYDVLVAAILVQREAGGDLAGLLRGLAADLEEARRVTADARTATAQARFTAGLVCALPLGAAALAELARPGALAAMAGAPLPRLMVVIAVLLELAALAAVRRLGRVTA